MFRFLNTVTAIGLTVALPGAATASLVESFDNVGALTGQGWSLQNNSSPVGSIGYFQGNEGIFSAQAGAANAYLGANFLNADDVGTISNWAITPVQTLSNGGTITFWTRTEDASTFADRLEVRLSTNGASTNVGTTATSVGDFSTLLLSINPTLIPSGYPGDWTPFTITLSGLPGPTNGRVAFRYFVTDAGPNGSNGDYIGIDTLAITSGGADAGAGAAVPEPTTLAVFGMLTASGLAVRRRQTCS